jgi:hypothetical protein
MWLRFVVFAELPFFRNLDALSSKATVISREFMKVYKGYGSLSQYLQVFVLTVQDTSVLEGI